MKLVKPSVNIMDEVDGNKILKKLERCARVCHKSEEHIKEDSAEKLLRGIMKKGHESVIEHSSLTTHIICDRSTAQQLTRHRIAAYSVESQKYCDYKGLQVICPPSIQGNQPNCDVEIELNNLYYKHEEKSLVDFKTQIWCRAITQSYVVYKELRKRGVPSEDARSVLPNATKTEVVSTFNMRTWRHVLNISCDKHAQWQIRDIMMLVLRTFHQNIPVLFDDIYEKYYGNK